MNYPELKTFSPRGLFLGICSILMAVLSGCQAIPAYEQAYLSQPGMQFSDSTVETDDPSLIAQVEPGTDDDGGAAASGCSACR